jgi:Flp pilus assembly protein TadG
MTRIRLARSDVNGRREDDSGLASIELVILLPAFILLLLLATYIGRMNNAQTAVDGAAQDAARAASEQRDLPDAQAAATAAAKAALVANGSLCTASTITATIRQPPDPFAVAIGTPSSVIIDVACTVNNADLAFPGLPIPAGQKKFTSTFTSPIDQHRVRTLS